MDPSDQRLKILGSLSGVFWDQLNPVDLHAALLFAQRLIQICKIQTLASSLESEVIEKVFAHSAIGEFK